MVYCCLALRPTNLLKSDQKWITSAMFTNAVEGICFERKAVY